MAAARDSRVVTEVLGRPRHLRFVHVLLRDALYEEIDSAKRSALHLAIGEAIERLSGADLDSRAAELAHHFLKAVQTGGSEGAIRYSILAARRAAAQLAFEDASRHYQTAIALLEPNDPASLPRRCDLLLALGEAELRAGERDASRAPSHGSLSSPDHCRPQTFSPELRWQLSPGLFAIEAGVIDSLLISLLEEALAALGTTDSSLRASVLARLAIALVWSDAEERRDALSHEALAVARRVGDPGDPRTRTRCTARCVLVAATPCRAQSVLVELGRSAEESKGDELSLLHRVLEIALYFEVGDVDAAYREIDRFGRSARHRRDPHAMWYVELFACVRASIRGRNSEAAEHSRSFLELGLRVGDVNAVNAYGAQLVRRSWDEGRHEEVVERIQEMIRLYPIHFAWKAALAIWDLESGRLTRHAARSSSLRWMSFLICRGTR